jgi:hypothetical protein
MPEPQKVTAIRAAIAERLGLELSEVELVERAVPGSTEDEPSFATVRVSRKEGLTDEAVHTAVFEVNALKWSPPDYFVQLRWEWKDA